MRLKKSFFVWFTFYCQFQEVTYFNLKKFCIFVTEVVITQELLSIYKYFWGAKCVYKMLSEASLDTWERCFKGHMTPVLCHHVISMKHHIEGIFATLSDINIKKLCYNFHWNNWRNTSEILRWCRSLKANLMELVLIIGQFGNFLKSLIS